jgi:hypothetical protein
VLSVGRVANSEPFELQDIDVEGLDLAGRAAEADEHAERRRQSSDAGNVVLPMPS